MKNLLLFHLESVNSILLNSSPDLFPNINLFLREATYFRNYFSSATSTMMTASDLFLGRTTALEASTYLEDCFSIQINNKDSFFDKIIDLGKNGVFFYITGKNIDFGDKHTCYDFTKVNSEKATTIESQTVGEFLLTLEKNINENKEFCYYIMDFTSHISKLPVLNVSNTDNNLELFRERYKIVDDTFAKVIEILKACNVYDNTLIVLYGDHGEDFMLHNIYEGYFHAMEPYKNLISCPLIIRDPSNVTGGNDYSLLSTIDIGNLILTKLGISTENLEREFVFSRNLFAGQKLEKNRFNKSYSVTNGQCQLIVSNKGLEMYLNKIDVIGSRNILDFYKLKDDGHIRWNNLFNMLKSSHFRYFFDEKTKTQFEAEFSILYGQLNRYLNDLYENKKSGMNLHKINYSSEAKRKMFFLFIRRIDNMLVFILRKIFKK